MKKILVYFSGGLGDFLLFTPSLRTYKKQYPKHQITLAWASRYCETGILKTNPYISNHIKTPHCWNDYNEDYYLGVHDICENFLKEDRKKFEQFVPIVKMPKKHKVYSYAEELGLVTVDSTRLELRIPNRVKKEVAIFLEREGLTRFNFVHSYSGNPIKNIPDSLVRQFEHLSQLPVIHLGKNILHRDITFTFELMRRATKVFVCDSVCMHTADALQKKEVIVYRKANVPWEWETVNPLNISYKEIIA